MKKILFAFVCLLASSTIFAQELPSTQVKDVNTGKKVDDDDDDLAEDVAAAVASHGVAQVRVRI